MNREKVLLVLAGALLALAIVGVAVVPGALESPDAGEEPPPGRVVVTEQVVSPGEVNGDSAELTLVTDLRHREGPVENVTIRFRAIDAASGLLTDETEVAVGDVDADGEFAVNGSLVVPREGSYRLKTTVYAGNDRVAETTTSVSGVQALTPEYADQDVAFTEGQVWPTIAVAVEDAGENRTTLRISASLTNAGSTASDDLQLGVRLRQADSNVVADEATSTVESIRPGRTDTVSVSVTVPADYNYYVDAALWHDGVLIDETQSVANLDPQQTISANETREDVEFEVGDFEEERSTGKSVEAGGMETAREEETPGFGVVVAIVAFAIVALLARRRR
jgi:PGF-CTERM protein